MNFSAPATSKNHEIQLQHSRHERKTEHQHLNELKKALQSKIQNKHVKSNDTRVA
ncbi:MAG: hypothetical protein JST79_15610 [Acidobacteria bacterium]|nr:hypothetical protein [Acidobacteriota bacterium]